MFHIDDSLKNRFRIPVEWHNTVARFLNNLVPGFGVRIVRPDNPGPSNPVTVELDPEAVDALGYARVPTPTEGGDAVAEMAAHAPEDVMQAPMDANGAADEEKEDDKAARVGSSAFAARADHRHLDPALHAERQTIVGAFFVDEAGQLSFSPPMFDRGGRFLGLDDESAFQLSVPLANLHAGDLDGLLRADGSGGVSVALFGTSHGTVAEGDHGHKTADITDWASATSGFLTNQDLLGYVSTNDLTVALSGYSKSGHKHTISDFTAPGCTASPAAPCFLLSDSVNGIYHSAQNPSVATVRAMCEKWTENGDSFGGGSGSGDPGNITHADITDWETATSGFLTHEDLSGYVATEDLTSTLAGYVSTDDLTAALADYVTNTDLGSYLEEGDFPNGFLAACASGASGSFEFVANVSWNGTSLCQSKRTVTVTNGIVTNLGSAGGATAFTTAVTYNAS